MWFDDPAARAAFRRGAREAFESSVIHMDARNKRCVTEWLRNLDEWHGGEPPAAPSNW